MKQILQSFNASLLLALLCLGLHGALGLVRASATETSLNDQQQEIATEVTDKIIADIAALKGNYPQLEHFGEAPYFSRELGAFRYDYQTRAASPTDTDRSHHALPGGCGIYFRLYPVNGAPTPWSRYFPWQSVGGDRAGITHEFYLAVGDGQERLRQALGDIVKKHQGDLFEKLTSEYLLKKHQVNLDADSALHALESPAAELSASALQFLRFSTLTAQQRATLWAGLQQRKYRLRAIIVAAGIMQAQDPDHLPEFYRDMVGVTIQAEKAGRDTFVATPFVTGWASDSRDARQALIGLIKESGSERFLPAALLVLHDDPVVADQLAVLDYFAKLPAEKSRPAFAAALGPAPRSVQARAAELAGSGHVAGLEKELTGLLDAPGSKVRRAAQAAVRTLGIPAKALTPARTLPDSAIQIAKALWACGLTEQDVVRACSPPSNEDDHPPALHDPRVLTKMDAESVHRRATEYAVGLEPEDWTRGLDVAGPDLLAAAVKVNATADAQLVYERLCDLFDTDDDILYRGLEGLGWQRFLTALDAYQQRHDNDALKVFREIVALEKRSRPYTYLDGYIKASRELLAGLAARNKEQPVAKTPVFQNVEACTRYWQAQFPDKTQRIHALIRAFEDIGAFDQERDRWREHNPARSPVVEALAREGAAAVEPLLDCLAHDARLTRIVEMNWDHSERPVRWVLGVQEAACAALEIIVPGTYLDQTNYRPFAKGDPEARAHVAAAFRAAWEKKKAQ